MNNREEITKEINQRKKQWDKKSNSEKLNHIDLHLIKARGELADARDELGWLSLKGVVDHTYRIRFSKTVLDIQERILIDLESDIRLFMEQDNEENEDEGKLIEVVN